MLDQKSCQPRATFVGNSSESRPKRAKEASPQAAIRGERVRSEAETRGRAAEKDRSAVPSSHPAEPSLRVVSGCRVKSAPHCF